MDSFERKVPLFRESAHTFMTSAQVPSSFSEVGGPSLAQVLIPSNSPLVLPYSRNFNTSAVLWRVGQSSAEGVGKWSEVEGILVSYAQCPIFFFPQRTGDAKSRATPMSAAHWAQGASKISIPGHNLLLEK